jgi:deoxyribonuclease V
VRLGATDVHYPASGGARAALVVAEDRRFEHIVGEQVLWLPDAAAYEPGNFASRELPAILAVLADADPVELVVVDGYVDLDPSGRPGLGGRLHQRIGIPVIGVAKSAFRTATHAAAVRRDSTVRPLYVTAIGVAVDEAATLVADMAGRFRIPDALRRVDALARGRISPTAPHGSA